MQQVFRKSHFDFRGLHLCDTCWNGQHFTDETVRVYCAYHKNHRDEDDEGCPKCRWTKGNKTVCLCAGADCECPCKKMEQNQRDEAFRRQESRRKNKEAQSSLLGGEVIQIGPTKHNDVG